MTRLRDWLIAAIAVGVLSIDGWGCSAAGGSPRYELVEAPPATSETSAPAAPAGVWLSEDSPLYEAQKAWGVEAPSEPLFEILPEAEVNAACGDQDASVSAVTGKQTMTLGCTTFLEVPVRILITQGLNAPVTKATKLHEMGHFLFGRLNHIKSEKCSILNTQSAYVMCAAGAPYSEPTPEDFDWAFGEDVP